MEIHYTTFLEFINLNLCNMDKIKISYLQLLNMLTQAPTISTLEFIQKINEISHIGDIIIAYYLDVEHQEPIIIGTGTIIFEPKIIHGGAYTGHIEDIVVHEKYRNQKIAKNIIDLLIKKSKSKNCCKITLNCKEQTEQFYIKFGFKKRGTQMAFFLTL